MAFDSVMNVSKDLSGNFIPRVGDNIDMGYLPVSLVKQVVYMPNGNKYFKEEMVFVVV